MDDYLASVYYDPNRSGGFGSLDRFIRMRKKEGKFNISRTKIKEWLMKQDAYTLHKLIRRHFKRNRVIVGGIDQQWQMGYWLFGLFLTKLRFPNGNEMPKRSFNVSYYYTYVSLFI